MKLYVWEDVLSDYTPGIMFAVADSVAGARKKIEEATNKTWYATGCKFGPVWESSQKLPEEYELDESPGFFLSGGG